MNFEIEYSVRWYTLCEEAELVAELVPGEIVVRPAAWSPSETQVFWRPTRNVQRRRSEAVRDESRVDVDEARAALVAVEADPAEVLHAESDSEIEAGGENENEEQDCIKLGPPLLGMSAYDMHKKQL